MGVPACSIVQKIGAISGVGPLPEATSHVGAEPRRHMQFKLKQQLQGAGEDNMEKLWVGYRE